MGETSGSLKCATFAANSVNPLPAEKTRQLSFTMWLRDNNTEECAVGLIWTEASVRDAGASRRADSWVAVGLRSHNRFGTEVR